MQKKNYLRKTLALVMAFLMIVTMMPVNVFAAVKKPVWDVEHQEDGDFWPLTRKNKLKRIGDSEPYRTVSLGYAGVYKNKAGKDVLRLRYRAYTGSVSALWKNLLIKLPEELYGDIDWTDPNTGMYVGTGGAVAKTAGKTEDAYTFGIKQFNTNQPKSATGSNNVVLMSIRDNLNFSTFATVEVPIDFVLKDGALDKLKGQETLIQARLVDEDFRRVYVQSTSDTTVIPYGNYTMSTIIPLNKVYDEDLTRDVQLFNYFLSALDTVPVLSATSYIKYNEEKGYLDVYYRQLKQSSGASKGLGHDDSQLGFRQAVSKQFLDILKADDDGTVAVVTIANHKDVLYDKDFTDENRNIKVKESDFTIKDDIGYIQAVGNDWNPEWDFKEGIKSVKATAKHFSDSVLNGAVSTGNTGVSTVVRYYIDKSKVTKDIKDGGIANYAFHSSLVRQDPWGTYILEGDTGSKELKLKKDQEIKISFNHRPYATDMTVDRGWQKKWLFIGDKPYQTSFRDTITHDKGNDYIWTVPYDMTIAPNTKISMESTAESSYKLRKGYNTSDFNGKTATLKLSNVDPSTPIYNITLNATKTSHYPRMLANSETLSGGSIVATNYLPKVEEIFTDSKTIEGHSYFDRAEMAFRNIDTSKLGKDKLGYGKYPETELDAKKQALSATNKEEEIRLREYDEGKKKETYTKYDGYKFDTSKPNPTSDNSTLPQQIVDNYPAFTTPRLLKDMPILVSNKDIVANSLESEDVIEQVQAKVHFDLSGQKSKIDGRTVIDKVAPLNKEYLFNFKREEVVLDQTKPDVKTIKEVFTKNDQYTASGFGKIDKDGKVTGIANIRVYSNPELVTDPQAPKMDTVTVKQELTDTNGQKTTIDRTVINYLDHNGDPYDIDATTTTADDPDDKTLKTDLENIEKKAVNDLLLRQFPVNEEVNLPNAKKIIGWTTVKLEDKKDSQGNVTKSAEEQYYDLLNSTNAAGEKDKIIRKLEDWKKVDDDQKAFTTDPNATRDIYIFDEASPLEDERTVYAVYGGLSLVLHSGNKDANVNEITVRIPVTQDDITYTDETLLDATTSSTLKNLAGKIVMKRMPKAPYTDKDTDVKDADVRLKEFKKDDHSFVGWTILSDQSNLRVGNNNPRISALIKGEITLEDDSKTAIPKESESLKNLIEDKQSGKTYKKATLPNGFTFAFSPGNFDENSDYTTEKAKGLKSRQELLDTVSEIHLYAVYRPFFKVTVHPQYQIVDKTDIDPANKKFGEYKDGVEEEKQKELQISLLTRTAVTGYGIPTVDAAANYNPIGEAIDSSTGKLNNDVVKVWYPKTSTADDMTWTVPGFDELGRTKSYVSVVVPKGKEDAYTNFANKFTDQSWSKLGISTYVKASGISKDPNAPKNLYRDTDLNRDPYGVELAKTQAFTLKRTVDDNGTQKEVTDAFTSATARKAILNTDEEEVTGYDIVMTNAPESLPTPQFDKVKDTDTKVTLEWNKGTAQAPTDYDKIDKIEFYLDGTTYTLPKDNTGKFTDGTVTAEINAAGDKLTVTGITLQGKGGKDLQAKYFATVAGTETSGEIGSTRIISDKISEPVNKMEQGVKNDPADNPSIKFTVPHKVLDQVGKDSKYIAEKWDPVNNEWVKVGEKVLTDANNDGKEYEMELTGEVADGEKVRIVSYESNPDAAYTEEEKQADPSLENGFSKPAYSTGDKHAAPGNGGEGTQYVTLDLKGPEPVVEKENDPPRNIKAKDEKFRRYINIEDQLDEVPNGKLILEIDRSGNGKGDPNNEKLEFESKEKLVEYIYSIPRIENMPSMWIYAKDRFGNQRLDDNKKGGIEVDYTATKQLILSISDVKAYRSSVVLKSSEDNANVTLTVYDKTGAEVLKVTANIANKNTSQTFDLIKADNTKYRLKKGDKIVFEGYVGTDTDFYANPTHVIVR